MTTRRAFLAASGAALALGLAPRRVDSTWLTYAPNVEQFWGPLPFLERLKKIGEAGFTRYEFGRWKTKDIEAIARSNDELGLQAVLFLGYPGLKGAKWKEGLLDTIPDAADLGTRLLVNKISLTSPDVDDKLDRPEQVDDLVEALKEAVGKVAETEAVLILEVGRPAPNGPKPLIGTAEEAAAVVKAVGSDRCKFAFAIDRPGVLGGKLPASIQALKGQVGYYRLVDFAVPKDEAEGRAYALALKAIQQSAYPDPIGLGLAPKAVPLDAIEAIRKLDAAAKALG